MQDENKNIILILIVLALFTGATIELSEGSTIIGIVLFIVAAGVISKIKLTGDNAAFKSSKIFLFVGIFIMGAVSAYNLTTRSSIGTLDSMTFIIGTSLFAMGTARNDLRQIGEFGLYISFVFTVLYLIFYSFFGYFNIGFLHIFDHYFVLMPTVAVLKIVGIPVEIIAIETITLYGEEAMTIVIGGPCSGLYSMFLLIGIVAGYSRIEKIEVRKSLFIMLFAISIAYLANLFRVIILYLTAYFYGLEAMSVVHTHIGWIIFAGTAGLIMYILNIKK
ncbi:archaeosortase C [Methanolobus sp. ZRKC2]|uniref:archaeosortase C n=1 Tax=Methanolobus sp. ZRKC2 TaxID=3125783 RepID=UPI00324A10A8